jgi:hypothetical protein
MQWTTLNKQKGEISFIILFQLFQTVDDDYWTGIPDCPHICYTPQGHIYKTDIKQYCIWDQMLYFYIKSVNKSPLFEDLVRFFNAENST